MPGVNSGFEDKKENNSEGQANEQENKPVPAWELSLTDKLNQKLLVNFLKRINETESPPNPDNSNNEGSEDW